MMPDDDPAPEIIADTPVVPDAPAVEDERARGGKMRRQA
jgi:hypothetical protein